MSLGILATTYIVIDLSDEVSRNDVEVAVVVSDECQNQGLGMELFRRVVQIARDGKLSRVDAEILPDHSAFIERRCFRYRCVQKARRYGSQQKKRLARNGVFKWDTAGTLHLATPLSLP
jgi:GNAT superfamily N-acetyltransferase